jgi:hypothetical protein
VAPLGGHPGIELLNTIIESNDRCSSRRPKQATLVKQMHPDATYNLDIATITSAIERSDIVVAAAAERLPAGYDQIDVAVLRWIVSEGRRTRRVSYPTN